MNILSIAIIIFLVLETLNVLTLYFAPGTTRGNGLGVFKAYEKSKNDEEVHALVKYLINWVAGTKIIFVALLIVILITGDDTTKLVSVIALIMTIATFFWRLFPIMKAADARGQISPAGYSRTLGIMIAVFMLVFVLALIVNFLVQ